MALDSLRVSREGAAQVSPSDWQLIDDWGGLKKYIRADDDENVSVRYESDVTKQIDRNKALQNEGFDRKSEWWHAAHIPAAIMYEWLVKYGVNFWNPAHAEGVRRLLNDGEYRYLKCKDIIL